MTKKRFWRKSGKEQAAKCPVCGKYMDKTTGMIDESIFAAGGFMTKSYKIATVWVCRDCNERERV